MGSGSLSSTLAPPVIEWIAAVLSLRVVFSRPRIVSGSICRPAKFSQGLPMRSKGGMPPLWIETNRVPSGLMAPGRTWLCQSAVTDRSIAAGGRI